MIRKTLSLVTLATIILVATSALAGLAPGDEAPGFTLTDTEGNEHSLQTYLDDKQTVVIEWFNPDCPFIIKHHQKNKTMNESFAKVKDHDVVWLAVNSSGEGKEGYGLKRNQKAVKDYKIPFPVLMDPSGKVGRLYGAKTTPHMFIITPDGQVAYNGAIDDNRSAQVLGETNYVLSALHDLLQGEGLSEESTRLCRRCVCHQSMVRNR
jgi:peroxiredoxin